MIGIAIMEATREAGNVACRHPLGCVQPRRQRLSCHLNAVLASDENDYIIVICHSNRSAVNHKASSGVSCSAHIKNGYFVGSSGRTDIFNNLPAESLGISGASARKDNRATGKIRVAQIPGKVISFLRAAATSIA